MQGNTVSLSADGNTMIEGGYGDNNYTGAFWVFKRYGSEWTQVGSKLTGSGSSGSYPDQGSSVSISADGTTAIESGFDDSGGTGASWAFTGMATAVIPSYYYSVIGLIKDSVIFINASAAPSGSRYFWDFGDGTASNTRNPVHFYTAQGAYNVCLTVTNPEGSAQSFCQIVIQVI